MRFVLSLAVVVLLSASSTAQVGAAVGKVELGNLQGGFPDTLAAGDAFGGGLAALGDLDADGVGDLAIGAPGANEGGFNRGAVWVVRLNPGGTVKGVTKLAEGSGGWVGTLLDASRLGARLAPVGDLDGDGVPDLAAMVARPARIVVLFLNADGSVKAQVENLFSDPVFVPPATGLDFNGERGFGGFDALGDLDCNGFMDLAVGAPYDEDGAGLWTGAVWFVRLQANGTIASTKKVSMLHGGFGGTLELGDLFGYSVARLPDLDGDGNPELGVGAARADEFFWVLFLDAAQNVKSEHAYFESSYGFRAQEVAPLPDLDGDGRRELAFGLPFRAGFLANDGTLRTWRDMVRASPALGSVPTGSDLGFRFAELGDLGGDGTLELALSLPGINEVWILTLGNSATRNGAGVNTQSLIQAAPPVLGQNWFGILDCTGVTSGPAFLLGRGAPASGVFLPSGELLIGGPRYFQVATGHVGAPVLFTAPIPVRTSLIDLPIFVQGACQGASGLRLSNALDLLISR